MSLVIQAVSDTKKAQQDLEQLNKRVENIDTSVSKASRSFSNFAAVAGAGIASSLATISLTRVSDEIVNFENRIKSSTDDLKEFTIANDELRRIAFKSASELGTVAQLYSRIAISAKEMGVSQATNLRTVETVSKALKVAGATAAEANSAILQFGQAIGSGKLQGDELRSLLENAPILAKAIADEFKVGIGSLKELGEKGELVSSRVLKGILSRQDEINKKFDEMGPTVEGSLKRLGVAFKILFGAAQRAVLGAGGFIPDFLNGLASKVYDFAVDFDYHLLRAKTAVLNFYLDASLFFSKIEEPLKEAGGAIMEFASAALGALTTLGASLFSSLYASFENTKNLINDIFSQTEVGTVVLSIFKDLAIIFTNGVEALRKLVSQVFEFDFSFNFSGLELVKASLNNVTAFIREATQNIDRLFSWLYDRIIGNSWVPDLVNGVIDWFSKLRDTFPIVNSVVSFIETSFKSLFDFISNSNVFKTLENSATSAFEKLKKVFSIEKKSSTIETLSKSLKELSNSNLDISLRNNLVDNLAIPQPSDTGVSKAQLSAVATVLGGALTLFTKIPSSIKYTAVAIAAMAAPLLYFSDNLKDAFKDAGPKFSDQFKKIADTFKKTVDNFKKTWTTSVLRRTLLQVTGQRDTVPGEVFGKVVDTSEEAYVGRGPLRKSSTRDLGHDVINALPSNWQVPAIAAVTGVVSLGIIGATSAGPVRAALLSLWTTIAGVSLVRIVDDSTLKKTFSGIAFSFVDLIEKGVSLLLNGSAFKDPFGLISIIAKTALLFEAGRKLLFAVGSAVLTAPTQASRGLGNVFDSMFNNRAIANLQERITSLPDKLNSQFAKANENFAKSLTLLSNAKDPATNRAIGQIKALELVNDRSIKAYGGVVATAALQSARLAEANAQRLNENIRNVNQTQNEMRQQQTLLQQRSDALKEAMRAQREAFVAGMRTWATGIAGTVGGVGGYQLGTEIARSMSESSDMAKIGTVIAVSMASQLILSGIASLFVTAIVGASTTAAAVIGGAITAAPILAGAIAITAAGFVVYELLRRIPEEWKTKVTEWFSDKNPFASKPARDILNAPDGRLRESIRSERFEPQGIAATERYESVNKQIKDLPFFEQLFTRLIQYNALVYSSKVREAWKAQEDNLKDLEKYREGLADQNAKFQLSVTTPLSTSIQKFDSAVGEFIFAIKPQQPTHTAAEPTKGVDRALLRADGGWIYGPGTATSDSIPAMLSNGEFVVNAKSATQHRSLLERINSGTGFAHYFTGGGVGSSGSAGNSNRMPSSDFIPAIPINPNTTLQVEDKNTAKNINELINSIKTRSYQTVDGKINPEAFRDTFKDIVSFAESFLNKKTVDKPIANTPPTPKEQVSEFQKAFDKKGADTSKVIAQALEKQGITGIDASNIKTDLTDSSRLKIADALVRISEMTEKAAEFTKLGKRFEAEKANANVREWRALLEKEILRAQFQGQLKAPVEIKNKTTDDDKTTYRSFSEVARSIEEIFGINQDVFSKLGRDEQRDLINRTVTEMNIRRKNSSPTFGASDGPFKAEGSDVDAALSEVDRLRNTIPSNREYGDRLKASIQNTIQRVSTLGTTLGLSVDGLQYASVTSLKDIEKKMLEIESLKKIQSAGDEDAKAISEKVRELTDGLRDQIKSVVLDSSNMFDRISALLIEAGLSLDKRVYKTLSAAARKKLLDIGEQLKKIDNASDDLPQELKDENAKRRRKYVDEANKLTGHMPPGELAGRALASDLHQGLSSALNNLFKGDMSKGGLFKTFAMNLLDTATNSIIQTATKGLSDKLLGEGSELFDTFTSFGKSLYDSAVASVSEVDIEGGGSKTGWLLEIGKKFKDIFSSVFSWFGGLLPFASGGYVRGPGTSTSDSIPARLSNGEFVVNAKATKDYLPVLSAINSGRALAFKDGGYVSESMLAIPSTSAGSIRSTPSESKQQQVFNINITGDISQQTRKEIYGMLPAIATGVNQYNRERK